MKLSKLDIFAVLLLLLGACLFFLPLFYPVSRLYVTPGYTNSDILHLNYPLRNMLDRAFHARSLPVWTDMLGTGFPLIGESQIQAFSLLNGILFRVFPTTTAFNLGYLISFFMLAIGTYLAAKQEGLSRFTSFFCACIFMLSGYSIVRIQHYNILPAFSFVPFIFVTLRHMLRHPKSRVWLFLPFLISQSLLSGHLQIAFGSVVFFGLLGAVWWFVHNKPTIQKQVVVKGAIVIVLSVGLSCIQLVPTLEYFSQTPRGQAVKLFGLPQQGLTIRNMLQFIRPYAGGDIRNGTFPISPSEQNFWESFNYIGVLPLILAFASLFVIRKHRKVLGYWLIIGSIFFLSLEGNSPLAFLYSLPPLSLFRAYTRLLVFAFFLLVLLAGQSFEMLLHALPFKKSLRVAAAALIIGISVVDIWHFAASFNPTEPVSHISAPPETARYLHSVHARRIYTLYGESPWQSTFIDEGWKYPDRYIYLSNLLAPDINELYQIPQASVYSGFTLQKQLLIGSIIKSDIDRDFKTNRVTLSLPGITMLQYLATDYIVSPYELTNTELVRVYTVKSPYKDLPDISVYHLPSAKPLFYLAHSVSGVTSLREMMMNLQKPEWNTSYDAIVAGGKPVTGGNTSGDRIDVKVLSDTEKKFSYASSRDAYFILSTYNYPGWRAYVDGRQAAIVSGNYYGMAVFAPEGHHEILFRFVPVSLYAGGVISGICLVIYLGFIIVPRYRRRV